jgi:hypothetical protein
MILIEHLFIDYFLVCLMGVCVDLVWLKACVLTCMYVWLDVVLCVYAVSTKLCECYQVATKSKQFSRNQNHFLFYGPSQTFQNIMPHKGIFVAKP